jgi:hypothetical protein
VDASGECRRAVESGTRSRTGTVVDPARSRRPLATLASLLGVVALALAASAAQAQDIEPRSYSNAPVGVNFLVAGYVYTTGGIAFDSAAPISDPDLRTSSAVLGYARILDVAGTSAKIDVVVPYTRLSGTAQFQGQAVERKTDGLAPPAFRFSINLYGAPALKLEDFLRWEQDLIVGVSLRVIAPLGQYNDEKIVNIGTNRWSFKPEIGVSKALGPWTFEATAAATFFTANDDFYGGVTRSQDPVYSFQGHLIYGFASGIWASLDATWYTGGRTTIDGVEGNDRQRNWRAGGTLAFPIDRRNSIKFYASNGVSSRTGNDYDLYGVAWQYRWGAGI